MSDTDETARAIAETKLGEEHWGFCEAGVEFADLQAMARLWLRVRRGKDEKVLEQDSGNQYDYLRDLLAEVENGE